MLMSKTNDLAISDSNVNMNIVEKYGTFRLQSDKEITENGKHTADVGFNGLSSVNVNVEGGGGSGATAYVWKLEDDGNEYCFRLNFDKVIENLNVDDIYYLYVYPYDTSRILIQKLTDDERFSRGFDFTITKVSDSEFKLNYKYDNHGEITEYEYTFTRGFEGYEDITLWQLNS